MAHADPVLQQLNRVHVKAGGNPVQPRGTSLAGGRRRVGEPSGKLPDGSFTALQEVAGHASGGDG